MIIILYAVRCAHPSPLTLQRDMNRRIIHPIGDRPTTMTY
jgi:hypothetical protein